MTTRSTTLTVGHHTFSAIGTFVLYTTPANTVVLLKTVSLTANVGGGTWAVYLNRPGFQFVYVINEALPNPAFKLYELWHVMEPGDQLVLQGPVATVSWWVSGALLPPAPA